jgi:hypothetical protein
LPGYFEDGNPCFVKKNGKEKNRIAPSERTFLVAVGFHAEIQCRLKSQVSFFVDREGPKGAEVNKGVL